jgi:mannose/fructose/N-acetylgalactosamine-specific phosphotransferase system component IID
VASEGKRITRMDLFGVFWRSFFLQTSWSFDRMQSLGFAFAMMPVLRRLYPDRTERSARLQDQMEYFNTQPYFANFVLGAAARAEEERASGVVPAPDPGDIKRTLKPLAAAVAVATLLGGAWWAPLLYLGLYNVVHIGMRGVLLAEGYRTGGDVVALLSRYNFTRMARLLKVLSLAGIGCIVGTITAWGPEFQAIEPPLYGLLLACAALAAVIGLSFLLRSGLSPVQLMLGLAALSLGLAWGGII